MIRSLIETFRKPGHLVMAQRELAEAQASLLEAQTGQEYAKRMAEYHADRIKRLTKYIGDAMEAEQSKDDQK
jgi:hypothetical protein